MVVEGVLDDWGVREKTFSFPSFRPGDGAGSWPEELFCHPPTGTATPLSSVTVSFFVLVTQTLPAPSMAIPLGPESL